MHIRAYIIPGARRGAGTGAGATGTTKSMVDKIGLVSRTVDDAKNSYLELERPRIVVQRVVRCTVFASRSCRCCLALLNKMVKIGKSNIYVWCSARGLQCGSWLAQEGSMIYC